MFVHASTDRLAFAAFLSTLLGSIPISFLALTPFLISSICLFEINSLMSHENCQHNLPWCCEMFVDSNVIYTFQLLDMAISIV